MTTANQLILVPNQILSATWGYEQTNVDFYKVLHYYPESGRVRLVQVQTFENPLHGDASTMQYTATPRPEQEIGKPFIRKAKQFGEDVYIRITSYKHAKRWHGKPVHGTSWA